MSGTIENTPVESYQGYYGKAPSHGDFLSKGLPRSFRDPWDIWLQSVLSASRADLAESWGDHYLTCPAYHFALSPGICGRQSWIGVMIPSVDQVGRYYPMTLCRSLPGHSDLFSVAREYKQWFEQAEPIVLSCLYESFSLEDFDSNIESLTLPSDNDGAGDDTTNLQRTVQEHTKNAWRTTALNPSQHQIYAPLLNAVLKKHNLSYSLFWTSGSDAMLPSTVMSQGLPPIDGASAFLDGNWDKWGWGNHRMMDCYIT
ncbi:MAG: type VI secretion system-associated protein TagF [Thiolinea sp.]